MAQSKQEINDLLAKSIKELAAGKSIDKIRIKDITDKAEVIRPTFYNHFQDKYELIEWIMEHELIEPIKPLLDNGMIDAAIMLLLKNIENDKAFYTAVSNMEGQDTFETIATRLVANVLEEIIDDDTQEISKAHPWLTKKMIAQYFSKTMCFVVKIWIDSGMPIDSAEMVEVYSLLMKTSLVDVMGEKK
ncbi:MAG: TetR/AcrR family transcriptional regulator C-terminal domain-containing protein [Lachnospiraceae bacterium]|nr:TetR/AcrR family transcriptional regulator C-terminal domain-containing protein [Lachnospiraceae bacterium]